MTTVYGHGSQWTIPRDASPSFRAKETNFFDMSAGIARYLGASDTVADKLRYRYGAPNRTRNNAKE